MEIIFAIIIYLIVISILSVFVTIKDKAAAKADERRIPEKALFFLAIMGGSLAMFITMRKIRHKTRHAKFMFGIPAIMLLQVAIIVAFFYLWGKFI